MASKIALIIVFLGVFSLIDDTFADSVIKVETIGYKESLNLTCKGISEANFFVEKQPVVAAVEGGEAKKEPTEKVETPAKVEPKKIENEDGKYILHGDDVLEIIDIRGEEIKAKFSCKDKNDETKEKTFSFEGVKPYIYKPEKLSITETTGGNAKLRCQMLFGTDEPTWSWTKDLNETALSNDDNYQIDSNATETTLTIKNVNDQHKGEYQCVLKNKHGQHSENINLRVKSALAALWPFLGIVAEVIILCIIILSYETRCGKKKSTEEDDNEQAQNLMGREGAQSSDLKKRTAKA
jgi:hypothetical protein